MEQESRSLNKIDEQVYFTIAGLDSSVQMEFNSLVEEYLKDYLLDCPVRVEWAMVMAAGTLPLEPKHKQLIGKRIVANLNQLANKHVWIRQAISGLKDEALPSSCLNLVQAIYLRGKALKESK